MTKYMGPKIKVFWLTEPARRTLPGHCYDPPYVLQDKSVNEWIEHSKLAYPFKIKGLEEEGATK